MKLEWNSLPYPSAYPWRLYDGCMLCAAFGTPDRERAVAFWNETHWVFQKLPDSVTTEEEMKAYIEFLVRSGTWRE